MNSAYRLPTLEFGSLLISFPLGLWMIITSLSQQELFLEGGNPSLLIASVVTLVFCCATMATAFLTDDSASGRAPTLILMALLTLTVGSFIWQRHELNRSGERIVETITRALPASIPYRATTRSDGTFSGEMSRAEYLCGSLNVLEYGYGGDIPPYEILIRNHTPGDLVDQIRKIRVTRLTSTPDNARAILSLSDQIQSWLSNQNGCSDRFILSYARTIELPQR